jgi:hypothetical protein
MPLRKKAAVRPPRRTAKPRRRARRADQSKPRGGVTGVEPPSTVVGTILDAVKDPRVPGAMSPTFERPKNPDLGPLIVSGGIGSTPASRDLQPTENQDRRPGRGSERPVPAARVRPSTEPSRAAKPSPSRRPRAANQRRHRRG